VLGEEEFVRPEDLPEEVHQSGPGGRVRLAPYQEQVNAAKRRILENTLRECGADMKSGASRLGIHENNLYRLIRTLGIRDTLDAYRRRS
jgi:DNA-binding NtrC family response regulator